MLDEVLYMQTRIFRMFIERTGLSPRAANRLFDQAGAWDFLSECYDSLHVESDQLALDDVLSLMRHKGVAW